MTASVTGWPRCASAVSFIFCRTMAEISSGWKRFVSPLNLTSIMGLPPSPRTTLNGQCFMSACTAGSSNFRPMRRLASKTVFEGFLAACPFAASPMSRSLSVKATNEGVVRLPSEFSMIWTPSRCQMPTQEKVVPKSMPMAGAFRFASSHTAGPARQSGQRAESRRLLRRGAAGWRQASHSLHSASAPRHGPGLGCREHEEPVAAAKALAQASGLASSTNLKRGNAIPAETRNPTARWQN
mmetsp:Transcript_75337/g.232533  ORF Transcript_75337/g.232533 Transcript_75337/m.232533 type:complete len:240 (+) Transcript_75337:1480-2199(+)